MLQPQHIKISFISYRSSFELWCAGRRPVKIIAKKNLSFNPMNISFNSSWIKTASVQLRVLKPKLKKSLADHKEHRQSSEPIKTRIRYMQPMPSTGKKLCKWVKPTEMPITVIIIHQISSPACHWSYSQVTDYIPANTGEFPSDIPQFSKLRAWRKIFEG